MAEALHDKVLGRLRNATSVSGDVIRSLSSYLQAMVAGNSVLGSPLATARVVAEAWLSSLRAAPPERVLPLWYIANDVLLTSKKDQRGAWLPAFADQLLEAATISGGACPGRIPDMARLTSIWSERAVYKPRFMGVVEAALKSAGPKPVEEEEGGGGGRLHHAGGGGGPAHASGQPGAGGRCGRHARAGGGSPPHARRRHRARAAPGEVEGGAAGESR